MVSSRKSGKAVDTAAAENLLLHHRPLIRAFSPLLHHLMVAADFDAASAAVACLSQLAQLFGGEHHPSLTARHLRLYARALSAHPPPDVRKSAAGQNVKTVLRTLKRLALVGAGKDARKSKKMAQVSNKRYISAMYKYNIRSVVESGANCDSRNDNTTSAG